MQLYNPSQLVFIWAVPVLILLFFWGKGEWDRRVSRLGEIPFIRSRLMPELSLGKRKLGWVLLIGVFLFSTLALARPQWGEEKKKVERKGVDLIFLLDTSLSMLAEDIKPSRLAKSKLEIKTLMRRLKGDRIGMVAFAGSSFLQCPLTLDYSAFLLFVDALKPGYIPDPGTSLAQAIELGIRAFPEESRKYRAMILFSDGEDLEGGVSQAVDAAKRAGVRIYAAGVGTEAGEPIPLRSLPGEKPSAYKKDREGQIVITRLNASLLTEIARETGGIYLPATPGEKEIDVILKHLETLGERQLRERLVTEREEHFGLFLLIAFLFLMGETLLGNRTKKTFAPVIPILAFFLLSGFINTPRSLVEKGNRLVQEKKYQSAVDQYRKAEVKRPNDPIIRHNLGTALYQLYQYRDAEKELEQGLAQAPDRPTQAKLLYNYGNTHYRLGNFEKAIGAYKKVLDLDPKDKDAKYNLEFLQKKKAQFEKKHQERQQQQQKPQPQPQQKQQQKQPSPSEKQEKEKQETPQSGTGEEEKEEGQQGQGREEEEQKQQGQEQKEKEAEKESPPERGAESEKPEQEQREEKPEERRAEEQKAGTQLESKGGGQKPLQGQMSLEDAKRILDVLREGEAQLQDLRRPPVRPQSREVLKDW